MALRLANIDDLIRQAFLLAYFIHRDRATSLRIVVRAMSKLEVAATAQGKRLYYRPVGRRLLRSTRLTRPRNKVLLTEQHLLQRLVYIESEPFERAKEQAQGTSAHVATTEDLLVHFIKHLIRIALKRNSFYATLGISRLLYSYTTPETMDIYNAVIQDPERVKDDYYYRSRKALLMRELQARFGALLRSTRGPRGDERFIANECQPCYAAFVRECLSLFTPWGTPCLVPQFRNPILDGIPLLAEPNGQANELEINRIHAILHPDCYRRLVEALGFATPDAQLAIPHFFLANNGDDGHNSGPMPRRQLAPLHDEELQAIKHELDAEAARRKRSSAELLRVLVDGRERAHFNLRYAAGTQLRLDAAAELLEVQACDATGAHSIAIHSLAEHETQTDGTPTSLSITLESGRRIEFTIRPVLNLSGEFDGAEVEIKCGERNPLKAAAYHLRRRLAARRDDALSRKARARIIGPAALLALLLCVVGLALYAHRHARHSESQPVVTQASPRPQERAVEPARPPTLVQSDNSQAVNPPAPVQHAPGVAPRPNQHADVKRNGARRGGEHTAVATEAARQPAETQEPSNRVGVGEPEQHRGWQQERPGVSLLAVKQVCLEVSGDAVLVPLLRAALEEHLRARGSWTVTSDKDEADACLKVRAVRAAGTTSPARVRVVARLVNADGAMLWPVRRRASGASYVGRTGEVAAGIVAGLVAASQGRAGQR